MSLEKQKCIPCEGEVEPLSATEVDNLKSQTPNWEITNSSIHRTFKFRNFAEAMEFANKIGAIAEEEKHHPDLHISWGKVRVELSTHAVKGLTINDFILAAKIDKLTKG